MDREDRHTYAAAAIALLLCALMVGYAFFYHPQTEWIVLPVAESTAEESSFSSLPERELPVSSMAVSSLPERESPVSSLTESEPSSAPVQSVPTVESQTSLININTADLQSLQTLPGIGEVLAQRIVDYRENNGAFSSIAELMQVSGIGEKKFAALAAYITV